MTTPLLNIKNLFAGYAAFNVLEGINLQVFPAEIVSIIGANGAGKTTTLLSISSLIPIKSGSVEFAGKSLLNIPAHEVVALGMSHVPEGRKIFTRLSVYENLKMGAYTRNNLSEISEDLEKVYQLFPVLKERRNQAGGTLSGGEQQMLAIARALMSRPKMLLLDEPSMGIAPILVEKIFQSLQELNQKGMTILLVEQNAHMALNLSNRAYVLETGRIILEDEAKNLLTSPRVQEAYLGG